MRRSCLLIWAFVFPVFALGQAAGEILPTEAAPHFAATKEAASATGVKSTVDLPVTQHMRNSGGNDRTKANPRGEPGKGYGLCVFTSLEIMSRWLNLGTMAGFQKWMESQPGGGFPAKVDQMLAAFCKAKGVPVPDYVQHTGGDDSFLDLAIATGRGACVTYAGFDGWYKNEWGQDCWIDHMVFLAHLDQDHACIIDNNRPGYWVWMTRKDFLVRWRARGGGWAVVFLASPPPPHPLAQMWGATAGCYCGDGCKCPAGECPSKCPVLVGQIRRQPQSCPPGGCPLTVPTQPNPFGPIYPPAGPSTVPAPMPGGEWRANTNGREWGYWVNGKCVAACFIDGRVEAVNENGIATGVPIAPPAALPAGVRQQVRPQPPASTEPEMVGENYGLMRDRIHQRPTFSINGSEVTEGEAREAIAGGMLANDADRWHLTAVGSAEFLARFKTDVGNLPVDLRAKLHTQGYAADSWTVKLFALPDGVCLRRPATARRAEQTGTLATADYTAAKLLELLAPITGVKPQPKPVPQPVNPQPAPNVEPKPDTPAKPEEQPDHTWIVVVVAAVVVFLLAKGR